MGASRPRCLIPTLCPACARHVKSELRMVERDGARGRRDKRLSLELWLNPVQRVMQCGRGVLARVDDVNGGRRWRLSWSDGVKAHPR
jgi:hypothetical protein